MQLSAQEQYKAIALIENGVQRFRNGDFEILQMKCFDKDEADWYKQYFQDHYPEIPVSVTWLKFG